MQHAPRRAPAILALAAAAAIFSSCSSGGSAPSGKPASTDPGKFVWHDLTTDDPAACKKFYGALFGWEYVETTVLGRPYTVARAGTQPVGGIHLPAPSNAGKTPAHWLSYMSVADVDATADKAKAAGAAVLAGPIEIGTIGRAAVLRDPQGAPFGLVHLSAGDPHDPAAPVETRSSGTSTSRTTWTRRWPSTTDWCPTRSRPRRAKPALHTWCSSRLAHVAGVFRVPDSQAKVPPNWLPYVLVSDPAALAARVEGLGGRVLLSPKSELRNGSLAIVADPTGAVVALQKFPF